MDGPVSRDPNLHLIVNGTRIKSVEIVDGLHRFSVKNGTPEIVIASRSVVPKDSDPNSQDPRRLGVPLHSLALSGPGVRIEIGPHCPALAEGFHEDEGTHRWTDGRAVIPREFLACLPGEVSIELLIGPTDLPYPDDTGAGGPAEVRPESGSGSRPTRPRGRQTGSDRQRDAGAVAISSRSP
jgi:hypothetical protein